jgi:hypothetical protein
MKKLFLGIVLSCLSMMTFAQTCPTPTGNSIIIKPTYSVASSVANQTDVKLCYNNTSTTKITALQFKIAYDTVAFKSPTVRLLIPDSISHYLQYYVTNGKIVITSVYNGTDLNQFTTALMLIILIHLENCLMLIFNIATHRYFNT